MRSPLRNLCATLAATSAVLGFVYLSLPVEAQKQNARLRQAQKVKKLPTYTETVNGVAIELVQIPAGKFLMGSPNGEGEADEHPQHEVSLSSFWMGKYEVTQEQWRAVASLPKVKIEFKPDPSNYKGNKFPVEGVRWQEAVEFCERVSRATGKAYRFPTEAEWEYACRAMTKDQYAGDLDSMAWYDINPPFAVGRKQPNDFGLYDMHGNVWEFCSDWYSANYYSQSPSVNPPGPGTGSNRVMRGGSWDDKAKYCRSAVRFSSEPEGRFANVGFRVAMTSN